MNAPADSTSRLFPWQIQPARLRSLREMLAQYGWIFAFSGTAFAHAQQQLVEALEQSRRTLEPEDDILIAVRKDLSHLRDTCRFVDGLKRVTPAIDRLLVQFEKGAVTSIAIGEIKSLENLFHDDLEQEQFFYVEPSAVAFYSQPQMPGEPPSEPFGHKVSLKFPKCAEDILEAGNCLALRRHTAAVFHLMRVMEGAVKQLGKRLGVKITDPKRETWYNILTAINGALNKLPSKTPAEIKRQRRFAAAAAALDNVRIASRNDVMHPKATYDRDSAKDVYASVRRFMVDLADAISWS